MRLLAKFTLVFVLVFGAGGLLASWLSYRFLQADARDQVLQQARPAHHHSPVSGGGAPWPTLRQFHVSWDVCLTGSFDRGFAQVQLTTHKSSGALGKHVLVLPVTDDQHALAGTFTHHELKSCIRRINRDKRRCPVVVLP